MNYVEDRERHDQTHDSQMPAKDVIEEAMKLLRGRPARRRERRELGHEVREKDDEICPRSDRKDRNDDGEASINSHSQSEPPNGMRLSCGAELE